MQPHLPTIAQQNLVQKTRDRPTFLLGRDVQLVDNAAILNFGLIFRMYLNTPEYRQGPAAAAPFPRQACRWERRRPRACVPGVPLNAAQFLRAYPDNPAAR